jgi:hypothetical protein
MIRSLGKSTLRPSLPSTNSVAPLWRDTHFRRVPSGTRLEFGMVYPGWHEVIVSGGKVNRLINGLCGEGLPTVHFSPANLSRGEQRPAHHRSGVGRRQHGLGFDPPLELLVHALDRIGRA